MNINLPFVPDLIYAYKFDLCILCKQEKEKDEKFDNKNCIHCKKSGRVMMWTYGVAVTRDLTGEFHGKD
jgi:hypothetical protein